MQTIDLNADLGEGGAHDAALMARASSVNIACGGHAGDEQSIRRAVGLALQAQVAIGAHPGYEDPVNFGRKPMFLSTGKSAASSSANSNASRGSTHSSTTSSRTAPSTTNPTRTRP